MLLLIDSDKNSQTGWFGYDLLVNQNVTDSQQTTLKQWNAKTSSWELLSQLSYVADANRLVVKIPRPLVGWEKEQIIFDFKWSDNPKDLKDPISLCTSGDTAPNRRFNYRCQWKKE